MKTDNNNNDPRALDWDSQIESYLKGHMSKEEEKTFLKELEYNQTLREKAIATARLIKELKEVGTERDKIIIDAFIVTKEQDVADIAKNTPSTSLESAAYSIDTDSFL